MKNLNGKYSPRVLLLVSLVSTSVFSCMSTHRTTARSEAASSTKSSEHEPCNFKFCTREVAPESYFTVAINNGRTTEWRKVKAQECKVDWDNDVPISQAGNPSLFYLTTFVYGGEQGEMQSTSFGGGKGEMFPPFMNLNKASQFDVKTSVSTPFGAETQSSQMSYVEGAATLDAVVIGVHGNQEVRRYTHHITLKLSSDAAHAGDMNWTTMLDTKSVGQDKWSESRQIADIRCFGLAAQ